MFGVYTEQALSLPSFFTSTLGTKCFIPQLKCFPWAPCAQCMAIITMAPNSIIMPTSNNTPALMQTLHRAHASLSWASATSPQPPQSQSGSNVWRHYLSMPLAVWHRVSLWETLIKHPRGGLAQQGSCETVNLPFITLCQNISLNRYRRHGRDMPPAMYESVDSGSSAEFQSSRCCLDCSAVMIFTL